MKRKILALEEKIIDEITQKQIDNFMRAFIILAS